MYLFFMEKMKYRRMKWLVQITHQAGGRTESTHDCLILSFGPSTSEMNTFQQAATLYSRLHLHKWLPAEFCKDKHLSPLATPVTKPSLSGAPDVGPLRLPSIFLHTHLLTCCSYQNKLKYLNCSWSLLLWHTSERVCICSAGRYSHVGKAKAAENK